MGSPAVDNAKGRTRSRARPYDVPVPDRVQRAGLAALNLSIRVEAAATQAWVDSFSAQRMRISVPLRSIAKEAAREGGGPIGRIIGGPPRQP